MVRARDRVQGPQRRRSSRIGRRLFAFNLLVLFVPVAGTFYLDVYEARLLETQERGMVQQARIVAAGLAVAGTNPEQIADLLQQIEERGDSRIRVYDGRGALIDDSARLGPRAQPRAPDEYSQVSDPRRRVLYRIGALLVRLRQFAGGLVRRGVGPARNDTGTDISSGGIPAEVRAALAGRYGAASRPTPGQRSLTLSSAVPVRHNGAVVGAVVVSQSTFRILQALYDVRLRLFEIVLISLVAAAVLTRIASSTIVNPIVRLQQAASALASRRRDFAGLFSRVQRHDEIGDLARSLEQLAAELDTHIQAAEGFAADVAHEFRNPLTAIRTAAETIADAESPEERERFLAMLVRDVDRLERLVSGVREMAHVDAQLSTEPRQVIDLRRVIDGMATRPGPADPVRVVVRQAPDALPVHASADRLRQVFENLLDNAASVSPAGSAVEIDSQRAIGEVVVTVADRGPGIPEAHMHRIFERFFSYRPDGDRRAHMGLGLPIAKAVVEGHGGRITVRNRPGGGTEFEVRLPAAPEPVQ